MRHCGVQRLCGWGIFSGIGLLLQWYLGLRHVVVAFDTAAGEDGSANGMLGMNIVY